MDVAALARACNAEGHKITWSRISNRIWFDRNNGGPSFKLKDWMAQLNAALVHADCTTVNRVAMFLAQVGAESGSFRYTEELASGEEYEGRSDLGNTHPGDGRRYKGRTYIQVTGRHNYGSVSAWAHSKGYVPTKTYFVDHPGELASAKYIFLGPIWYWTVARNMNIYADAKDIVGATEAVNGGFNNLSGRTARWHQALDVGKPLLPSGVPKRNPTPKPTPSSSVTVVTVKRGDTLASIAAAHHTTWQNLQKLNHISNPNVIFVGEKLKVRSTAKHSAPVTKPKPRVKPSPDPKTVVVHSGDTLSSIAGIHHTTWQKLQRLNNLRNPNLIYVGQHLRIR